MQIPHHFYHPTEGGRSIGIVRANQYSVDLQALVQTNWQNTNLIVQIERISAVEQVE